VHIASSLSQRLKNAVLATRAAAENSAIKSNRETLITAARVAQDAMQLSAIQRLVLMELAVTHAPKGEGAPVVFPSNQRLAKKCGTSERNLRRVTNDLGKLGLMHKRASANGKRYRKVVNGVEVTFGFDLSPLLARKAEFEGIIAERDAAAKARRHALDLITISRRQVKEAIEWLTHHCVVSADEIHARFSALVDDTPSRSSKTAVRPGLVDAWAQLTSDALALFAAQEQQTIVVVETPDAIEVFPAEESANDGQNVRHIELENTHLSNEAFKKEVPRESPSPQRHENEFDLKLVLAACPIVSNYQYPIRSAQDLVAAAKFLLPFMGGSEAIWQEGLSTIGPAMTAVATIFVVQRYDDDVTSNRPNGIANPNGVLRSIIRDIASGKCSLASDLKRLCAKRLQ
jgi:replication initiation protein RepC